jgi:hypothetical protein
MHRQSSPSSGGCERRESCSRRTRWEVTLSLLVLSTDNASRVRDGYVEPKDVTKARLGRSPDRADAVLMAFAVPTEPTRVANPNALVAAGTSRARVCLSQMGGRSRAWPPTSGRYGPRRAATRSGGCGSGSGEPERLAPTQPARLREPPCRAGGGAAHSAWTRACWRTSSATRERPRRSRASRFSDPRPREG